MLERHVEDKTDVPYTGASQVLENRDEVEELVVVSVRKPAGYRNGVLGVEYVRGRRVVNDNGVLEISPDLREILDVVS